MRWKLYAGISAVFALGGVAGGLLGTAFERDRLRKMERAGPVQLIAGLGRRLEDELKLDSGQARRIREIYANTRPQIQQMERERRRQLRQILDAAQPRILEVLTPTQEERYQQLQEKLQQRLRLREPSQESAPPDPPAPPVVPPN